MVKHYNRMKKTSLILTGLLGLNVLLTNQAFASLTAVTMDEIKSSYDSRNFSQTVKLCEDYLRSYPQDSDGWLYEGYANYQLKNYSAAENNFQKALTLDHKNSEAWLALTQVYIAMSQVSKAMDTVESGLISNPAHKDLLLEKAKIYYLQKQPDAAINTLEEVLKLYPHDPQAAVALKDLKAEQTPLKATTTPETTTPASATTTPETTTPAPTTVQPAIVKQPSTPKVTVSTAPAKPKIDYDLIKALYVNNQLRQAETAAKSYLSEYPTDVDVQFLLGKIYQKQQRWELAKQQFETVLKSDANYSDARFALIQTLFAMHDYQGVIVVANAGMNNSQDRPTLQYDVATALYAMNDYQGALTTLKSIPENNQNKKSTDLYNEINEITNYQYESYMQVGTYDSLIEVKNPNQAWTLSSVYTQYHTPKGTIGLQLNYQTRPNLDAPQYEIYAIPQITKTNYANLTYAHANNPNLFADQLVYGEDFQLLPYNFTISLGDTYRKLANFYFNSYTGSLGKYFGSIYLQLRPTYYVPDKGPNASLYTLTLQKYFGVIDYVGFAVSEGTAPDLADLDAPSFIKTDTQIYMLTGQHEINKQFAMQYGIGEEIQNFGNQDLRRYTYINFGLNFRNV